MEPRIQTACLLLLTAVAVSEEAMIAAQRKLGAAGVSASYEGGATLAALEALVARGDVAEGDKVLLLITAGHGVALAR